MFQLTILNLQMQSISIGEIKAYASSRAYLYKLVVKSTGLQNSRFSQILARNDSHSNYTELKNHSHTGSGVGE